MKLYYEDGDCLCNTIHAVMLFLPIGYLEPYHSEKGMLHKAIETLEECLTAEHLFLPSQHPNIATSQFLKLT